MAGFQRLEGSTRLAANGCTTSSNKDGRLRSRMHWRPGPLTCVPRVIVADIAGRESVLLLQKNLSAAYAKAERSIGAARRCAYRHGAGRNPKDGHGPSTADFPRCIAEHRRLAVVADTVLYFVRPVDIRLVAVETPRFVAASSTVRTVFDRSAYLVTNQSPGIS